MTNPMQDFYPTPPKLIRMMLEGIDFKTVSTVLEPSAGKGDLADAVKRRVSSGFSHASAGIDCIELDPNLQYILRGKGYPVIHDDFLTFSTTKRYDLVIANFPFSRGDEHLSHALSILEHSGGGSLVCLVNAETIHNPYTNLRKAIADTLDSYDAEVTWLDHAFAQSERPTDVRVSLIRVTIPQQVHTPILLDGLAEAVGLSGHSGQAQDIVNADPVIAMVQHFNLECRVGARLIDEYNALRPYILDALPSGKERDQYAKPILDLEVHGGGGWQHNLVNDYVEATRHKYWQALIRHPRFQNRYTSNILTDLEAQLKTLAGFDFTVFNIRQLESQLRSSITTGVEEAIIKMFDTFTRRFAYFDYGKNIHYFNGWRTNKAHKIGRKVIVPINGYSAYRWDPDRFDSYRVAQEISDLVKAFNYLADDATGVPESVMHNTMSGLSNATAAQARDLDFWYFTATFYKKGTCHITFKDQRLLDKLNIYGSQRKGWLPPSYGRKSYRDLDREERDVVDSFQGAVAYEQVMAEPGFYLADPASATALPMGSLVGA